MTTYVTPAVRAVAERFGIDLDAVEGTGVGGRIRLDDVWTHAPADAQAKRKATRVQPADADLVPAPATRFNIPKMVRLMPSQLNRGREVEIDEFAINPLLDDFKASFSPDVVQAALAFDPNVTQMFTGGSVPLFTAGGFDPQLLLRLPWSVRHHAATAEKPSVVADIFERCGSGDWAAVDNARFLGSQHPGLEAYRLRFNAWSESQWASPRYEEKQKLTLADWREQSSSDVDKMKNWKF